MNQMSGDGSYQQVAADSIYQRDVDQSIRAHHLALTCSGLDRNVRGTCDQRNNLPNACLEKRKRARLCVALERTWPAPQIKSESV